MNFSKRNTQGFTLIELLVVTLIVLVLGGVMFADYHTGQEHLALQRSAHKLSQDLRQIQEMAMSAKEIGPEGNKFYPTGGFGIHFDTDEPTYYILFADCNDNRKYNTGPSVCAPDVPEILESGLVTLESKIEITELSPSLPQGLDITFSAPDPIISISGGVAEAEITLSTLSNETKTIKINKAGLISVE